MDNYKAVDHYTHWAAQQFVVAHLKIREVVIVAAVDNRALEAEVVAVQHFGRAADSSSDFVRCTAVAEKPHSCARFAAYRHLVVRQMLVWHLKSTWHSDRHSDSTQNES